MIIKVTGLNCCSMSLQVSGNRTYKAKWRTQINQGWGFCGFFRICGFFFQCFQSSAFLRISAVSSFSQREREKCGKYTYKITLPEPQREMQKNCSQKISLTEPQLCEPLNCERHGQCTLSFC